MSFKKEIDNYLKSGENNNITNDIFILSPSKHVAKKKLLNILCSIKDNFHLPLKDIKVIGSAHIGFSLVKPIGKKEIKKYDKDSDIDIAIINRDLFYKLYFQTCKTTNFFEDNTYFESPYKKEMFKRNIILGYIRPDTIGDPKQRMVWLEFFKELSIEHKTKISAAVYINELSFHKKLDLAYKIYKQKIMED